LRSARLDAGACLSQFHRRLCDELHIEQVFDGLQNAKGLAAKQRAAQNHR
jgi:hypothetical protein